MHNDFGHTELREILIRTEKCKYTDLFALFYCILKLDEKIV